MIIPFVLIMLATLFACSYLQEPPKKRIVGVWKHHKDDVFLVFSRDGSMKFKISYPQGDYEIFGNYELINKNYLKIEFHHQYGAISGEQIFINPRVLKVTIHANEIIFHGLQINDFEDQKFIRTKQMLN